MVKGKRFIQSEEKPEYIWKKGKEHPKWAVLCFCPNSFANIESYLIYSTKYKNDFDKTFFYLGKHTAVLSRRIDILFIETSKISENYQVL